MYCLKKISIKQYFMENYLSAFSSKLISATEIWKKSCIWQMWNFFPYFSVLILYFDDYYVAIT